MSTDHHAPVTPRRSYRPGSWLGIFGAHTVVLLPPTEKHRVGALWEMVDDGAGFDDVLDALVSEGLRGLPAFVLVGEDEGTTRILLRGPASATLTTAGETVELVGSSGATWVERSLTGVTASEIEVEETDTEDLPVAEGVARVGRVDTPPYAAPERTAEPVQGFASVEPLETAAYPMVPEPPRDLPVPRPADVDHDGMTRSGGMSPEEFVAPQPGIPGQPPAPSVTARPVANLVFSSGETVEVDRAVLVGRAPEARRFSAGDQPRLVTVPSPNQEISSTHLEIRPGSGADHGSAVATDLGSTNGTVLVQPGLPPEELQPGVAAQLLPGAIIDLGDGVTIQITNP